MPGLRAVSVVGVTGCLYCLLEAGNLVLRPWPRRREAFRSWILRTWSRGLLWSFGVRVERHGEPPREPFLLVANHLTYLDILVLGAEVGGAFVTKSEIAGWPVAGRLCRASGMIFVDRGSKRDLVRVAQRIEQALELGRGVILFPEGTTSRGESLLPFRPPLLTVACRNGHAVHHAVISYRTPPTAPPPDEVVCWWGNAPLMPHLRRLLRLPWIASAVTFGNEPIQDSDRKRLAERLYGAMEENFIASAEPPEPAAPRAPAAAPPRGWRPAP
jgi:1-acyl-sn-glycerol-3-phosphate acyltransferase